MSIDLDDLQAEIKESFKDRLNDADYPDEIVEKYAEKWASKAVEGIKNNMPEKEDE